MADRIDCRPEVRDTPFIKLNGELSSDAWKLIGKLGRDAEPTPPHYLGLNEIEILDKKLKDVKPIHEHYHNQGVSVERADLLKSLDQSYGKDKQVSFRDQLRQFETRAWANSITKDEVAQTYKEIGRILTAHGATPLTPELRKQVAQEVLRSCSDPTVISQGAHNTCNVTAVEVRTYSLHPAKAAKLVADVATTGEYRTGHGISIKLDTASMIPDKEALKSTPALGLRQYATQLFNLAAVNIWYRSARPGTRYEQRLSTIDGHQVVEEHVTDYSSGKPVPVLNPITHKVLDSPYLAADQIAFISDAITGHHEPFAVLSVDAKCTELPGAKKSDVHAANIVDESHLPIILQTLKQKHLLPAIADVDTRVEPLNFDSGSGIYGEGGGHVVNVTDYAGGKTQRVSLDNEWSQQQDHLDRSVDLHDLYLCIGGSNVARLDAYVNAEEARKKGVDSPAQELKRVQYEIPIGIENYANMAADAVLRCKTTERKIAGTERSHWLQSLSTIVNSVPASDKVGLLKRVQSDRVCTDDEFGKLMAGAAKSISFQKSEASRNLDDETKKACIRATTSLAEYLITLPATIKKHYFAEMHQD